MNSLGDGGWPTKVDVGVPTNIALLPPAAFQQRAGDGDGAPAAKGKQPPPLERL